MSDLRLWLTYLNVALPVLCVLNFSRGIAQRGFGWGVVAGISLYEGILMMVPLLLGTMGFLFVEVYRWVLVIVALELLVRGIVQMGAFVDALRRFRYQPRWIDVLIVGCFWELVVLVVAQASFDWWGGPGEFDAQSYHIPRALMWSWQGNFQPFRTAIWQQLGSAYGGTASLLPGVFLGIGYLGVGFAGCMYAFGAAAAVYVIARSFHLSQRASLAAALAFLSFPAVGLRLRHVSSDIAATFPILAGVALFRACDSPMRSFPVFIMLVGLGAAAKQYAAFSGVFLGIFFFAQHWRAFLSQWRLWLVCLGSALVGLIPIVLSYYPVYRAFGDINGGAEGLNHSVVGLGLQGVKESLVYHVVYWLVEPLSLLKLESARIEYERLGIPQLYSYFSMTAGPELVPWFHSEKSRSGFLPLIALPWLIASVKRGYRWKSLLGFVALLVVQVGLLKFNHTGRFVIVPLGAFALLWGALAERALATVVVAVMLSFKVDLNHLDVVGWKPPPFRSVNLADFACSDWLEELKEGPILVLSRPISVDTFMVCPTGEGRFEYLTCPEDGDWIAHLRKKGEHFHWLLIPENDYSFVPGPAYPSAFSPVCLPIQTPTLREWLTEAGWQLRLDRYTVL